MASLSGAGGFWGINFDAFTPDGSNPPGNAIVDGYYVATYSNEAVAGNEKISYVSFVASRKAGLKDLNIRAAILAVGDGTGGGDVKWEITPRVNGANLSALSDTKTFLNVAGNRQNFDFLIPLASYAAGDLIQLTLRRKSSDAADTYDGTVGLAAIEVEADV